MKRCFIRIDSFVKKILLNESHRYNRISLLCNEKLGVWGNFRYINWQMVCVLGHFAFCIHCMQSKQKSTLRLNEWRKNLDGPDSRSKKAPYTYQIYSINVIKMCGWVPPWSNLFISSILMFQTLIEVRLCQLPNKTDKIVDKVKKIESHTLRTLVHLSLIHIQLQYESQKATFGQCYKIHAYTEWKESSECFLSLHNLADLFFGSIKKFKKGQEEHT